VSVVRPRCESAARPAPGSLVAPAITPLSTFHLAKVTLLVDDAPISDGDDVSLVRPWV